MPKKTQRNHKKAPVDLDPVYIECPHLHFKADTIDRGALSREQHLNLLSTPKGYRWDAMNEEGQDEGDQEGVRSTTSVNKPGPKLICRRRIRKPEQAYIHNFLTEIWALLTPEMIDRLKEMLMIEFGMSPMEAEMFVVQQRNKSIQKTSHDIQVEDNGKCKCCHGNNCTIVIKKNSDAYKSKHKLNKRHQWIKDFSKLVSGKLTDVIVTQLSARRSKRVKELAARVLEQLCDLTGEHCTLSDPKTRVQRIMVFAADRFALWVLNDMRQKGRMKSGCKHGVIDTCECGTSISPEKLFKPEDKDNITPYTNRMYASYGTATPARMISTPAEDKDNITPYTNRMHASYGTATPARMISTPATISSLPYENEYFRPCLCDIPKSCTCKKTAEYNISKMGGVEPYICNAPKCTCMDGFKPTDNLKSERFLPTAKISGDKETKDSLYYISQLVSNLVDESSEKAESEKRQSVHSQGATILGAKSRRPSPKSDEYEVAEKTFYEEKTIEKTEYHETERKLSQTGSFNTTLRKSAEQDNTGLTERPDGSKLSVKEPKDISKVSLRASQDASEGPRLSAKELKDASKHSIRAPHDASDGPRLSVKGPKDTSKLSVKESQVASELSVANGPQGSKLSTAKEAQDKLTQEVKDASKLSVIKEPGGSKSSIKSYVHPQFSKTDSKVDKSAPPLKENIFDQKRSLDIVVKNEEDGKYAVSVKGDVEKVINLVDRTASQELVFLLEQIAKRGKMNKKDVPLIDKSLFDGNAALEFVYDDASKQLNVVTLQDGKPTMKYPLSNMTLKISMEKPGQASEFEKSSKQGPISKDYLVKSYREEAEKLLSKELLSDSNIKKDIKTNELVDKLRTSKRSRSSSKERKLGVIPEETLSQLGTHETTKLMQEASKSKEAKNTTETSEMMPNASKSKEIQNSPETSKMMTEVSKSKDSPETYKIQEASKSKEVVSSTEPVPSTSKQADGFNTRKSETGSKLDMSKDLPLKFGHKNEFTQTDKEIKSKMVDEFTETFIQVKEVSCQTSLQLSLNATVEQDKKNDKRGAEVPKPKINYAEEGVQANFPYKDKRREIIIYEPESSINSASDIKVDDKKTFSDGI